ncbi:MAG: hypothetical protein HQL07_05265 [Nitrospirae bacterium]|nr:hypothetical protein [Magnetococcales bacterium]
MVVFLVLVLSPVLTLSAAPAMEQRVLPLLQGFEWHDHPADFLDLGEGVDRALMDIAANPQWHGVIRFRALAALRYFPNPTVGHFLENLIGEDSSPGLVRRGLSAYAQAFGQQEPSRVASLAEPLLVHGNPSVRMQAAQILQDLPRNTVSIRVQQALDSGANLAQPEGTVR